MGPGSAAGEVRWWGKFSGNLPLEIHVVLADLLGRLAQDIGEPTLLLSATWTGPTAALAAQLAGLLDHVPAPTVRSDHVRGYLDAMRAYAGSPAREAFAATSHVAYDPLDAAGVDDLLDRVRAAQDSGLKEAGISIDALGGKVADVASADTAPEFSPRPRRDRAFVVPQR